MNVVFWPHLLALLFPLTTTVFLYTGPHPWWVAPVFAIPGFLMLFFDSRPIAERREPYPLSANWPYDALLYILAMLHFVNVWLLLRLFEVQHVFSMDMFMVPIVAGSSAGLAIINAHELIHRRSTLERLLGRLLLCTAIYEHFYTEHIRGHHVRVGTRDDPATARFGETFQQFWSRTVPAQFKSAWQIEKRRLGDPNMRWNDLRMVRNRVLHGILVEALLVGAILVFFGIPSLIAFLLLARSAVQRLEAVNYFEHWGLQRAAARPAGTVSWDTHSWVTFYSLTGLSRHADHHANPARPYQQLRIDESAPLLPAGYLAMVDMVTMRNAEFMKLATQELERLGLAPSMPAAATPLGASAVAAAAPDTVRSHALRRLWNGIGNKPRFLIWNGGLFLGITLAASIEQQTAFVDVLLHNLPILAGFIVLLNAQRALVRRGRMHETLAMSVCLAIMACIGAMSEQFL